jgi:heme oxygenase (biliverdin-IX-beta and delta-forming)
LAQKSVIRERLRSTTAETHERLHRHAGFAAAAAGAISLVDYRLLLERLWGFHRSFEIAVGVSAARDGLSLDLAQRKRSSMLEVDLIALGASRQQIAELPQYEWLTRMRNRAETMGALYVIEGSTLGGAVIARALAPVCQPIGGEGRRFFLGYGDQHGAMWRAFLSQLEACSQSAAEELDLVEGARTAFLSFEAWMDGWRDCRGVPDRRAAVADG